VRQLTRKTNLNALVKYDLLFFGRMPVLLNFPMHR